MIVSASYKTDIPAFYGQWFARRLDAGYCKVNNPMNRRPFVVSLRKEDVSGFVFWTRNARPFFSVLDRLKGMGLPFYVQFTATSYPKEIEPRVIPSWESIAQVREISGAFGSNAVVWRYDPILLSDLTPDDFHLRNFRRIAEQLRGYTDEVVLSFVHDYSKTVRNLKSVGLTKDIGWHDPAPSQRQRLVSQLVESAGENGLKVSICSQLSSLVPGAHEARCIDDDRLSSIAGLRIVEPEKGNRPQCRCAASRDIGAYDTCPHGCAYCYAVRNRDRALERYKRHDVAGEFLFDEGPATAEQGQLFKVLES